MLLVRLLKIHLKTTRSLFSVPSLKGLSKGSTYRKGAYNALKFMSANLAEGLQEKIKKL